MSHQLANLLDRGSHLLQHRGKGVAALVKQNP